MNVLQDTIGDLDLLFATGCMIFVSKAVDDLPKVNVAGPFADAFPSPHEDYVSLLRSQFQSRSRRDGNEISVQT